MMLKKFPSVSTEYVTHRPIGFTDTSILLDFKETDIKLSIATSPETAGPAFCETALISKEKKEVVYIGKLGYGDVIRHDTEEEFSENLKMLFGKGSTL
ncbi:MAG: hypothetical protein Edafosvirus9_30 [Edafosvirus sp.]|uniref:Uncharacterized protein n=1 Tax=Edafosvirus sp. TaxID=2487765 RepID=A0A3G4ZTT5_9VIRU|nr:MAG: hypothetical protein Edafosvirus9_30 [Edafosvirus sp.]